MNNTTSDARQKDDGATERDMLPKPDCMPRYAGSKRLANKTAIVTGGDSGIGRAVSILFAREGANVAIVYQHSDEDARDTVGMIEEEGQKAIYVKGDIGSKAFCTDIVAQTKQALGAPDIVVNNAGEQHPKADVDAIDEDQLRQTFQTNIFGQFFLTQAVLPDLKEGSSIICTTSVTAYRGQDLLIDYASSKGAILSFIRALSHKLAPKGIRVNGVAPGPIWTPLIPSTFPKDKVESFGKSTPLGRAGQPNEVAPAFLFLACADSSYITGQVIHPNGGEPVAS
ncbi:MAG: SDR family oxidoreductase [Rhizobiaceae bacterium]|nr:SDR family oxidoreductase [Rhizobiaceae bacterium]